ncbi:DUF5689 domain-containing protein [Pedobacter mucosus]|uniref:DUF5689 domain-containing protein n=1 Tax=Pedobacter mucosus TaxID=2895286 RepID=UPI001EE4AC92|nr:DUF5689 domain-containing protein [Pedobacter mucosus]UKT65548.1 DUF5689 domain-containing protein [Pedobacter mucosus]
MKKTLKYIFLLTVLVGILAGCKRDDDYVNSIPSSFISNFDLKKLYKGADLQLTPASMGGAVSIKGVVISDFRAGNAPTGLLIMQNSRLAGNGIDSLRGMAFNIGADAANFIPGDSIHVKVEGGTLKRVNGILQIVGISAGSISKIASGKTPKILIVNTARFLAAPSTFESTLVTIANSVFEPEITTGATYSGDKTINDGYGKAIVHTETTASYGTSALSPSGNFTGIPFLISSSGTNQIQLWMRKEDDFVFVALPKLSPIVISGFLVDPNGGDANNEYIQFLATRDINFATTPFSVYTSNNAGATTFPTLGWNTGGARTYKFNLTSGTVSKGEYFYVGGTPKRINGSSSVLSTDISSAKWIRSVDYSVATGAVGADGIGAKTDNLLANSGNVAGIAIFEGTTVTLASTPLDVIFFGGANGNFYSVGPPEVGYKITINDFYTTFNPSTRGTQLYYGAGTNVNRLSFPGATSFAKLGGLYDATSGRWVNGRALTNVPLTVTSPLTAIEGGTALVN